jgi:hypothetical protein
MNESGAGNGDRLWTLVEAEAAGHDLEVRRANPEAARWSIGRDDVWLGISPRALLVELGTPDQAPAAQARVIVQHAVGRLSAMRSALSRLHEAAALQGVALRVEVDPTLAGTVVSRRDDLGFVTNLASVVGKLATAEALDQHLSVVLTSGSAVADRIAFGISAPCLSCGRPTTTGYALRPRGFLREDGALVERRIGWGDLVCAMRCEMHTGYMTAEWCALSRVPAARAKAACAAYYADAPMAVHLTPFTPYNGLQIIAGRGSSVATLAALPDLLWRALQQHGFVMPDRIRVCAPTTAILIIAEAGVPTKVMRQVADATVLIHRKHQAEVGHRFREPIELVLTR